MRRTKIVATLGPSSTNRQIFRQLVDEGLDVARINLSHGTTEMHRETIQMVRAVEQEIGRPIGVMLDTAGPEVRLRTREDSGLELEVGQRVTLGRGPEADLRPSIPDVIEHLTPGSQLVLGDGNIQLVVDESGDPAVLRVTAGGWLGNNKKVTCPGDIWPLPVLTEADEDALQMGLAEGIDWIAASFIRTADDVVAVRRQLEQWGGHVPIIAKIETRAAIENLESVVRMADGLMVARGDLGVEYPPEDVPWLQKKIIDAANRAGKPVITATQMLESMVQGNRPTRAEVTDIAHAVMEGTDAVMLSEETAAGRYPVEAVRVMARAAEVSENHPDDGGVLHRFVSGTVTDAVCHAALTAAEDLDAQVIITATQNGGTAFSMAAHRPRVPVLAVTPCAPAARRLTLVWGVHSQLMRSHDSLEKTMSEAISMAVRGGWAAAGDRAILTAGAPLGESGSTNLLRVVTIGEILLRGQGMGPEGEVQGPVIVVNRSGDANVEQVRGKVLVIHAGEPELVPLMQAAAAILVEEGGLTSPAAILGISEGIPTVVGVSAASERLSSGQWVTVDAAGGLVRTAGERDTED